MDAEGTAKAGVLLDSAAEALGLASFNQLEGLTLRGVGDALWTGQGASPSDPTRHRQIELRTALDFEHGRYYRRLVSRDERGRVMFCTVDVARGEEVHDFDCLSRVAELRDSGSGDALLANWRALRPHGLVEAARQAGAVDVDGADGERAILRFRLGGVERTLEIDRRTHLPRRLSWLGTTVLGDSVTRALEFGDYRDMGGWLFPFRFSYVNPGGSGQDIRYEEVRDTAPDSDSLYRLPADARRVEPSRSPDGPTTRRVAQGVYEVRNVIPDYNILFVDTGDGVAVFDAPGGAEASRRVLEIVSERLPGSALRWVVPTHFHHDHLSGLGAFVDAGATVITTGGNVEFIRELIAGSGATASGRASSDVEVVRARRTMGRGPGQVVLHAVDGRPHVDEILIPYLPGPRVMHVADLFWKGPDGHVRPADPETDALVEILRELQLAPAELVLTHGEPANMEQVERALELRAGGE